MEKNYQIQCEKLNAKKVVSWLNDIDHTYPFDEEGLREAIRAIRLLTRIHTDVAYRLVVQTTEVVVIRL